MNKSITISTSLGQITGLKKDDHIQFLGVPYASASRFSYASIISSWSSIAGDSPLDATKYGPACPQKRCWYAHLEIPERMFYHKEFRDGVDYDYSEDCLNLNIYTPDTTGKVPVLVFIHGGGFDSGANFDSCINGSVYPSMGVVCVSINYRVGIFGYLTHEEIFNEYGREGNFGLDDQFTALCWIKEHILEFGGDPDNITVMGQSAGAISIQYLCLSDKCKGLFNRAIMLSGAGLFPKFSLPRYSKDTREYWSDLASVIGVSSLEEYRNIDAKAIFDGLEIVKARRKDNTYNTMPVIDDYLLTAPVDQLISNPLKIDYMVGCTNNDMYAFLMEKIAKKYSRQVGAYLYYFDIDAPGDDNNAAFHSSDLRYIFGTLSASHRPYDEDDFAASQLMINYISNFVKTGNPNAENLPLWKPGDKPLCIRKPMSKTKMGRANQFTLLHNTISKGDPK